MTECVLVGVDSGGTRTNVKVVFDSSDADPVFRTYERAETFSGSLEPDRIIEVAHSVFSPLPGKLKQLLGANKVPVYVWIAAAGYTPWTADKFGAALDVAKEIVGSNLAAIGAANDASSILFGTDADGVIVAGTGSSVIVRKENGAFKISGGHEWVACDYGSGFWIGLRGIRTAFVDFDSGNEDSALLGRLAHAYGLTRRGSKQQTVDERKLVEKVRELAIADSNMKREIARFAEDICDLAQTGDSDAQDLVKGGAEELAKVAARTVYRHLRHAKQVKLAQVGSLFENSIYRQSFESLVAMRVGPGTERNLEITWDWLPNGMDVCVAIARRLADGDHKIYPFPRDEFVPVIRPYGLMAD